MGLGAEGGVFLQSDVVHFDDAVAIVATQLVVF